jgi:hypothetical protein
MDCEACRTSPAPPQVGPHEAAKLECALATVRDVVERKLDGSADVLASAARAPLLTAAPKEGVEPAHATEVAHEDVERLGKINVTEAEPARPTTTSETGLTEAVVLRTLLRIP